MISSPLPPSPSPGVPGILPVAPVREERETSSNPRPDPATILSTIRAAIAADTYNSAVVLGAIAEAAQALTGATAAALATRREGLVICRARSGDMAPEIGSRLSVDSGISGECLRTGKVLRCDDTLKDLRADPEVCRRLGLRAIAAVPLRGRRGTMGVLEAFSTRPYAFAEEHMDCLMRLAELAEAARLRESGVVDAVVEPKPLPAVSVASALPASGAVASGAILRAKDTLSVQLRDRIDLKKARVILAALAVPLLMLLGFSGWGSWRKLPTQSAVQTAAAQPQPVASIQTPSPAAGSDLVWKPSPAHLSASPAAVNPGIQIASKREVDQSPAPTLTSATSTPNTVTDVPAPSVGAIEAPSAPDPPKLTEIPPDKTRLAALASVPVGMPEFGSPVSQGLSGGVLQHKVVPAYPLAALPLRLGGTVVLEMTVGEKGNVQEVKIVSGPPLLTAAAVDAVRQWRYSPFLLDGKPVKMQKQVSISFRAP